VVDVRVAQPHPALELGCDLTDGAEQRPERSRVLEVQAELVVGAAGGEQVGDRRDVCRQVGPAQLGDPAFPGPDPHHAVVVEHRHPVGGEPQVALQPGGSEPEAQLERFDRVLRGVGTGATVGKRDRWVEQRGESLLHRSRSWHLLLACRLRRAGARS
jgi:hypothetical protein